MYLLRIRAVRNNELYYALFGAIMASGIGLDLISREKREKCMDFLLTKPRGRSRLFCEKLLAALVMLLVSNAVFFAASLILYHTYAPDPSIIDRALLAASSLLWTELFCWLKRKNLVIKMPDGVPPAVQESFAALIPADDLVFEHAINVPTLRIDGMTLAGE